MGNFHALRSGGPTGQVFLGMLSLWHFPEPFTSELKFSTETFSPKFNSKWQCRKIARPNSSNLLHFLLEMMNALITFAL